jgi:nicotinamidase-related amidase
VLVDHGCVLKTAVDAFERDLTPWIIEDASASHAGVAAHEAGLLVARRFIGGRQIVRAIEVPHGPISVTV